MTRNHGNIRKYRNSAFARQYGHCYYCKQPTWHSDPDQYAARHRLTIGQAARFQCTAEHLLARKDGGRDDSANIVAACQFCNQKRHARANPLCLERYRALVSRRVGAGHWHGARLLGKFKQRFGVTEPELINAPLGRFQPKPPVEK